ncbi:HNH endonuclease [Amaricoccus sp. B4]|uniref:HNH endonuclease n=1 Tax=Amaricoccus sp. B4 TaxID=3368557 RepID=UPI00371DC561
MKWHRPSSAVHRDKRWPALRLMAKRRDHFRCVKCFGRGRLEVDHIKPVRTHPELSFDLNNLQTLCGRCHGAKTRKEVGLPELSEDRRAWRDHVQAIARNHRAKRNEDA